MDFLPIDCRVNERKASLIELESGCKHWFLVK